ncbi:FGGY-family carbohydrate kinase [Opitutus sp. ER46]|uniref:FGGY-family carbohydrate kinase n=1 Tax=Opitutus sp. ER46 TaxID=2161864 RepID=UPI000D300B9C|nr:FGGY-family carbohydrate kinase [Opitutus sp. ER46]PTX95710.1 ribulokinase [Opitutus sp. ER46]
MKYFLGLDVGTGSARAGVFTGKGVRLGSASAPIRLWKPAPDHVEQSSEDIWRACRVAVQQALRAAGLNGDAIDGIGFDATCSLVAIDAEGKPVSISTTGRAEQNVMVWMDHRATAQAERINATRHAVLRYVGGAVSPEMQTPKLLWLKESLPTHWRRTAQFFDLADYLTYRATGDATRSLCTVVCKWTYLGHAGLDGSGWDRDFFRQVGLDELVDDGFARIGARIRPMGQPLGRGLTATAARELGLRAGTPVGVGIIDAHAGGIGLLGTSAGQGRLRAADLNRRLALIGGTSSCHMAVSREPRFVRGIWGPYYSAMLPGFWLTEGGQSATGALIDHIVFSHAAAGVLKLEARRQSRTVYEVLNARVEALGKAAGLPSSSLLTRELHVLPDFHGNRSPRSDPTLRGVVSGLSLSATLDDLARLYLATIQAVAYGTRHIIAEMNRKGYAIDTVLVCGGGSKNPLFLREHATITGCRLILPREPESVLLGSAILGAAAAGGGKLPALMVAMSGEGRAVEPAGGAVAGYHEAKYRVFHRLHRDFLAARRLMQAR